MARSSLVSAVVSNTYKLTWGKRHKLTKLSVHDTRMGAGVRTNLEISYPGHKLRRSKVAMAALPLLSNPGYSWQGWPSS